MFLVNNKYLGKKWFVIKVNTAANPNTRGKVLNGDVKCGISKYGADSFFRNKVCASSMWTMEWGLYKI